ARIKQTSSASPTGGFNSVTPELLQLLNSSPLRLVVKSLLVCSSQKPTWRNWQTRWTQNPVHASECGFDPLRRQSAISGFSGFAAQATAKKWQSAVSDEFRTMARYAPMNFVIQRIAHHMVGHCDCCDGYRALQYHDSELG